MKKTISVLMMVLLAAMLMVSCNNNTNSPDQSAYNIGDKGPAGGYIFYDVDADNDTGNQDGLKSSDCGWRYLEAAQDDLGVKYAFGYYRPDGTTNTAVGTAYGIGKGKSNTEALVAKMGAMTYIGDGNIKDLYAAKVCDSYNTKVDGVTYDDWFLPSMSELWYMKENLHKHDPSLGNFKTSDSYWSSEEYSGADNATSYWFDTEHGTGGVNKSETKYVRPARFVK